MNFDNAPDPMLGQVVGFPFVIFVPFVVTSQPGLAALRLRGRSARPPAYPWGDVLGHQSRPLDAVWAAWPGCPASLSVSVARDANSLQLRQVARSMREDRANGLMDAAPKRTITRDTANHQQVRCVDCT